MKKHEEPFFGQAPGFFTYLRQERGLRDLSIRQYRYSLERFAAYLDKFGCHRLLDICPVLLSGFVTDASQEVGKRPRGSAQGARPVSLRRGAHFT